MTSSRATTFDLAAITTICFGYFIVSSFDAVMNGFPSARLTEEALLGLVVYEVAMGSLALAFLWMRHYPLMRLVPRPSGASGVRGILLFLVAMSAAWLSMALFPADQRAQHTALFEGEAIPLYAVLLLSVVNGLYEEVFLLAFLQHELMRHGVSFAIGASLLVRVLYHTYQGHVGAVAVLVFGLVVAIYYARTGELWPPVLAHMLADVAALA
ncbi:MAG: CPBP family intramembrane glutamic endopeptidase [Burkholderiales bacterium]|nr:CPBP family intramembrane glutamic endopeptidase [Burkholderiales bacterium]